MKRRGGVGFDVSTIRPKGLNTSNAAKTTDGIEVFMERFSNSTDLADKYLPNGKSGIVTFGLKKGFEAAKKVAESTKIFALLANIGDTKSLIIHPSSTTHSQLNEEEQTSTGVSSDLVRISVGIEDPLDLINDLEQALEKVFKKKGQD